LSTSLNFASSCNQKHEHKSITIYIYINHFQILRKNFANIWLLGTNSWILTSSIDWSSTILPNRAPTKESPAPVVSTALTWKASTDPLKFWFVQKRRKIVKTDSIIRATWHTF
jgi:hypothetical protein